MRQRGRYWENSTNLVHHVWDIEMNINVEHLKARTKYENRMTIHLYATYKKEINVWIRSSNGNSGSILTVKEKQWIHWKCEMFRCELILIFNSIWPHQSGNFNDDYDASLLKNCVLMTAEAFNLFSIWFSALPFIVL